ncbi:copper resistance protein B [Sphingobium cupriresistens]|uniref:Copper resistance protein B n=1 Tax=Sphingobium cupriresistens TaxID=1132417 RepID=A0A8G2DWX6_9SPHN|nr:copper resistance protein B [Sphingobium cupriresistens]RYM08970.1 copper resistance protein B [Sphingobium cupriresistens]
MKRLIVATLLAGIATPAIAQDHSQMDHSAHQMPHPEEAPAAPEPADPHAGHSDPAPAEPSNPHAGHAMPASDDAVPKGVAPPIPTDHAADALYDPATMASARAAMTKENGGMTFSQLMIDRFEYRAQKGGDGYAWEGEGWIGGDINRLAIKSEGEGVIGGRLHQAEFQALYSRAIDPWWNIVAGVRQDFRPQPQRTYATIGIEGLAPYWFELEAQAFLSDKGDAHLRVEGSYDQRITQRLVLQPAAEVNIAAQDVPELGVGSGLSTIELGLRLRYEIAREFAPYIGVNWERSLGDTARYARAAGEGASATSLVMGIRFWF